MNIRGPFCILTICVFLCSIPMVYAADSALYVSPEGIVSTSGPIHVGSDATPVGQFTITTPDQPRFELSNTTTGKRWRFTVANDKFAINQLAVAGTEFQVFETGDILITGYLTENSDVNSKQDIVPVHGGNILEKLRNLEISEWSYKDAPSVRHVGPMAQDFYASFGLGKTDKGIATLDTSGIALAAIKALIEENVLLKERLSLLEQHQAKLQAAVSELTADQGEQRILTSTSVD